MAWHARPGGVTLPPNDTPAEWSAAWFTPIDYTHLNYLNDNLNFLRNPPGVLVLRDTIGTARTTTLTTGITVMTGTFPSYAGGNVYVSLTSLLSMNTAGNSARLAIKLTDNLSVVKYIEFSGRVISSSFFVLQAPTSSGVRSATTSVIANLSVLATGNITVDVILSTSNLGTASAKNTSLLMREL